MTPAGIGAGSVVGLKRAALSELLPREDDQADVGEPDEEPDHQAKQYPEAFIGEQLAGAAVHQWKGRQHQDVDARVDERREPQERRERRGLA